MEIIKKENFAPFIPILKILCVVAAFSATSLLLFKDFYFYDWNEKKETIVYSIPMVFLFFYWAKSRLDEEYSLRIELISLDVLAIFFTGLRLFGLLYHSGHVLFLVYTFVTTSNKSYRILCVPMILITAYFKVFYWRDFITPLIGAGIAWTLIYFRNRKISNLEGKQAQ